MSDRTASRATPVHLAAQYAAVAHGEALGSPVEQAERLRDRLSRCWAPRLKPLIEAAADTHRAEILVGSLFSAAPVRLAACSAGLPWVAVNRKVLCRPESATATGAGLRPTRAAFCRLLRTQYASCKLRHARFGSRL